MTPGRTYAFGRFRLDADARLLFRDETRIALTPKAVDVLVTLLENRGAPVARETLFGKVWSDAVVEDGTLSSHISLLRRTLGGELIETIPKRGYRFVGDVSEVPQEPARVLLAVLPFENLSGSRKYDSFSDGLTEEMITQLGRLNPERLGVIARTSSMTYKSTDKTVEQIGRELGVSYVLEGSARRDGNRVRITAQLIQVSDQTHLWAESYEAALENILSLQARVSSEVAKQIQVRLLPAEHPPRVVIPAAYDAWLTGRYLWNRRGEQDLQTSIRSFQEAIQADDAYAPAYSGLADCYLTLMDRGHLPHGEAMASARPAIVKALQLDDQLAEAHVSCGHAALHEFDWPAAQRELRRGIQLSPSSSTARYYYANYLVAMGRIDEAVFEAEESVRLDPMSPAAHSNLASVLWFAGDDSRSLGHAERSLELNPNLSRAYDDIGRAHEQMGALDTAIEMFERAVSIDELANDCFASAAHAHALAGHRQKALELLQQLERAARTEFVSPYSFALIHVALGNDDEVFRWLDKAYDERSSALPFLGVNPRFRRLRGDARFTRLLQRLGL